MRILIIVVSGIAGYRLDSVLGHFPDHLCWGACQRSIIGENPWALCRKGRQFLVRWVVLPNPTYCQFFLPRASSECVAASSPLRPVSSRPGSGHSARPGGTGGRRGISLTGPRISCQAGHVRGRRPRDIGLPSVILVGRPEGATGKETEPVRKGLRELRGEVVRMGARKGEEGEEGEEARPEAVVCGEEGEEAHKAWPTDGERSHARRSSSPSTSTPIHEHASAARQNHG
jgi:hypothetical protein